jgi:hypothetical protein
LGIRGGNLALGDGILRHFGCRIFVKRQFIMQSQEENQDLKYDNILVTPRGITEVNGNKIMIFVPATEVERITLKYGRSDHRPIVSLAVGVIFALIGVFGLIEFIIATRGYRYEMGMMAFGLIGGSFIHEALKERYFLEVRSSKGTRRLVLSKNARKSDVHIFCENVRTIYKYDITEAG